MSWLKQRLFMRDERLYLQDICDAADAVGQFLKDVSKEDLLDSDMLQSAIIQKFSVIGEAAARVSEEIKSRHPSIKWKQIIGMRNILIHKYFAVDWEFIWVTAIERVPELNRQIRELLKSEFPGEKKVE